MPGGPAESLLGERTTPALVKQYEDQYGLNDPLPVQYVKYIRTLLERRPRRQHGAIGGSSRRRSGIGFPATIELAIVAMVFAVSIGLPLGFYSAKHYGRPGDHAALFVSLIGISIPVFFLAIMLKYVFAVKLGWLPSVGREDILADPRPPDRLLHPRRDHQPRPAGFWDAFKHLILPAIALGSIPLAIITRITRASVVDVQNEDYVRTARAKGLRPRSSTGATSCATRCCRSRPSSACRRACCSRARC